MKKAKRTTRDADDYRPPRAALATARRAMAGYTILIEPDDELGFVGHARECPTILADGTTASKCAEALQFALETGLAAMVEQGQKLPKPLAEAKRTEQVNIRLTPGEKASLLRESSRRGFRGIADLIRAQTIDRLTAS